MGLGICSQVRRPNGLIRLFLFFSFLSIPHPLNPRSNALNDGRLLGCSVHIQPTLLPLPTSTPLVILLQLNDYIPQELSTTPSTVCFPPNATPAKQSIQRALQPLKSTLSKLEGTDGKETLLCESQ